MKSELSSIGGILYIGNNTPDCICQALEGGSMAIWFY